MSDSDHSESSGEEGGASDAGGRPGIKSQSEDRIGTRHGDKVGLLLGLVGPNGVPISRNGCHVFWQEWVRNTMFIPMRLTGEERRLLGLLEAALNVMSMRSF